MNFSDWISEQKNATRWREFLRLYGQAVLDGQAPDIAFRDVLNQCGFTKSERAWIESNRGRGWS